MPANELKHTFTIVQYIHMHCFMLVRQIQANSRGNRVDGSTFDLFHHYVPNAPCMPCLHIGVVPGVSMGRHIFPSHSSHLGVVCSTPFAHQESGPEPTQGLLRVRTAARVRAQGFEHGQRHVFSPFEPEAPSSSYPPHHATAQWPRELDLPTFLRHESSSSPRAKTSICSFSRNKYRLFLTSNRP